MPPPSWQIPARQWQEHETQGTEDSFRGHRRRRHERHCRGAPQPGLFGQRFGHEPLGGARAPGEPGCQGPRRTPGRACGRRRLRGGLHGRARRQSGSAPCPSPARAGGAACADAGRADEAQAGGGHCRNARQDHDHQPGRLHPGQGGPGSYLRDRRAPEQRWRQCPAGQWRLHRGRGRRIRCLVPEPAAHDRGRHQHRRRPHGHLRP